MDTHPAPAHPQVELTQLDRDLLLALIAHRSREKAASALGYSDRHVRRLTGTLLNRLGVPTTHAAVALAVASEALQVLPIPTPGAGTRPSDRG